MIAGGLNRVDLYMRNSGAGITHRLPIILGLDGAGVIEEAGESAPYRAGDPVVIYPGQPCETCEFCRKGEEVLCTRGRIFGEQVDGTFTEFVCAPVGSVMPKPELARFCSGGVPQRRLAHGVENDRDESAPLAGRVGPHLRRRRLGLARGDANRERARRTNDRHLARRDEARTGACLRRGRDGPRYGRKRRRPRHGDHGEAWRRCRRRECRQGGLARGDAPFNAPDPAPRR